MGLDNWQVWMWRTWSRNRTLAGCNIYIPVLSVASNKDEDLEAHEKEAGGSHLCLFSRLAKKKVVGCDDGADDDGADDKARSSFRFGFVCSLCCSGVGI